MPEPDKDEPSIRLQDAVERYRAKFGETPPMTIIVPPERYPELIRAMDQAVASGRRLTVADVEAIAGIKLPDGWNREDGPVI
jgi:hypothetical protein